MRGLNPQFLSDLQSGRLAPILERVQLDQTLCIELRDDYLNVYPDVADACGFRRLRNNSPRIPYTLAE